MISAKINSINVLVKQGTTILEAAERVGVKIPTLCKHKDLNATAACGICVVKNRGSQKLIRACCTPIEKGADIITHDPEIIETRRTVIELILSKHPNECLTCGRNTTCELQQLAADFGIRRESFVSIVPDLPQDVSTNAIVLEPRKCVLCGRCIEVCQNNQDVWALSFLERGFNTRISPAGDICLAESPCVQCGQCSAHCPTGAIFEHDHTVEVWDSLNDKTKYCVVQIAPAVRVAIGEAFGHSPGTNLTKKTYAALRRMGFEAVFDTNFGADVTIMEEAAEFVERFVRGKSVLPLITTCCPSWVDYMEKYYPDMIDHFSSCKSPQQMVGALSKTYYAQKKNIDPKNMIVVSVMPCTAKKFEISRAKEMFASGQQDVDISITTRECARMIKQAGIDFNKMPNEQADHLLADYTGAGTIFGATGGVMEAALRTAYNVVTNEELGNIEIMEVRGLSGVKEAKIPLAGKEVNIAVAHGLNNVKFVLEKVRNAKKRGEEPPYHFIEIMACPGGCIGGGGQPYGISDEVRMKRAKALYDDDAACEFRRSHENPFVKQLYAEFLEKPLSHISEQLLHTAYKPLPTYKK